MLQRFIARLMSVRIVDVLEVVEIEKQDRRADLEAFAQHRWQSAAVKQAGERIVIDELLQHRLRCQEIDV